MFKEYVLENKYFCDYVAYDGDGKRTQGDKLAGGFCHVRIMFKGIPEGEARLLAELLRNCASTSSEQMEKHVTTAYGYTEIVIS